MTTKFIGIKKFRQNIGTIWKEANDNNIKYIVMHHSVPVLEVNPISKQGLIVKTLESDIENAREQIKSNDVYSEGEVYKKLGF